MKGIDAAHPERIEGYQYDESAVFSIDGERYPA